MAIPSADGLETRHSPRSGKARPADSIWKTLRFPNLSASKTGLSTVWGNGFNAVPLILKRVKTYA